MRILYFVQYFNLPHEPGGSRAYQFAHRWTEAGHQVTVVTGAVNHKTLTVPERYRRRLVTSEEVEGIRLMRVWSFAGIRGSFRKRLLNFLSYAVTAGILGPLLGGPADVVFASSTPLTVGLPGWWTSLIRRAPFLFEVRDLWPQSAVVAGVLRPRALPTRVAAALARWLYTRAVRVVAVTRGIGEGLKEEGVPAEKVLVVPNGVDDWMLEGEPPREPEKRFQLVYCGALGRWNGLSQILDAAVLLRDRPRPAPGADGRGPSSLAPEIVFIGDGDERESLRARAEREGLSAVSFVGAVPKREAFARIRRASACVVATWNHPFQKMVLANKIFDYLAAGRPVIVAADGEMAELVREAACGLVVPPEAPERLAAAIEGMAAMTPLERDRLGANGRSFIVRRYRRSDLAQRLLQSFAEVTGKPAGTDAPAQPEARARNVR